MTWHFPLKCLPVPAGWPGIIVLGDSGDRRFGKKMRIVIFNSLRERVLDIIRGPAGVQRSSRGREMATELGTDRAPKSP